MAFRPATWISLPQATPTPSPTGLAAGAVDTSDRAITGRRRLPVLKNLNLNSQKPEPKHFTVLGE